jgi:hypothetical protein
LIVTGPLICWYAARFVPFIRPVEQIVELPAHETVGLVLIAIASYLLAIAGVARDRCGDQFLPGNRFDRFATSFDFRLFRKSPRRFKNSAEAYRWYEWSTNGWFMPFCCSAGIILALCLWLIASRKPIDLISGLVYGSGFLIAYFGILAFPLGIYRLGCGWPLEAELWGNDLGNFLSSRPMTNSNIAGVKLNLVAKSVLTTSAIWAAVFLLASVVLFAIGQAPDPFFPPIVRWWYFPVLLLGFWAIAASLNVLILTGDLRRLHRLATVTVSGFILWTLLRVFVRDFPLSSEPEALIILAVISILGIGLVLGTVSLFAAARRQCLISFPMALACASTWLVLSALILCEKLRHPTEPLAIYLCVVELASLVVMPFAAAPLAVAHNRTR